MNNLFDEKSLQISRLMKFLDFYLTIIAFLASYQLRIILLDPFQNSHFFSYIAILPMILLIFGYSLPYFGANQSPRTASIFSYSWATLKGILFGIAALLTLLYSMKIQNVSRLSILLFTIIEIIFLTTSRIIIRAYFLKSIKQGKNSLRVLIIGTGERAKELSQNLRKYTDWGISIVGYLDIDPIKVGTIVLGTRVIGTVQDISAILKNNVIDEVILAIPRAMLEDVEEIAYACQDEGVKFRIMADIFTLKVARMSLVGLGKIPLLTLEPVVQDETKLFVKRLFDLFFVLLISPILLIFCIFIAIAIKIDSPGPVFFNQMRVGLKKRLFKMYKFRSMVENSEEILKNIEHLNEADGPNFKMKNDPRITRIGKFLRNTSLDEFPQFINVFMGDMSLVGPRPMSIRDVDLFDKGIQRKRFSVKPGMTCIWQISGRSNLSFDKWLELDLNYIENWSLRLDLEILIKTIPVVIKGNGAM